ncbi:MAG: DUF2934 domain-containing protein [Vicinamibacterales bacterium]
MAKLKTATRSQESAMLSPAATQHPSRAEIEECAYYRYVERGRLDGFDVDDWLAAEADVRPSPEVLAESA